ncbi:hypothetical protein B0H17DRAFT_1150281 [Mycena rosella]|uniref:Uncharacterized protein n=1 Tax=Mycena rosella TaxID=1033263 RepID=A0AAD7FQ35_MYCRO|nr:hypothetical protein B0H17DRAFT_1150281 [Mycena rosella]
MTPPPRRDSANADGRRTIPRRFSSSQHTIDASLARHCTAHDIHVLAYEIYPLLAYAAPRSATIHEHLYRGRTLISILHPTSRCTACSHTVTAACAYEDLDFTMRARAQSPLAAARDTTHPAQHAHQQNCEHESSGVGSDDGRVCRTGRGSATTWNQVVGSGVTSGKKAWRGMGGWRGSLPMDAPTASTSTGTPAPRARPRASPGPPLARDTTDPEDDDEHDLAPAQPAAIRCNARRAHESRPERCGGFLATDAEHSHTRDESYCDLGRNALAPARPRSARCEDAASRTAQHPHMHPPALGLAAMRRSATHDSRSPLPDVTTTPGVRDGGAAPDLGVRGSGRGKGEGNAGGRGRGARSADVRRDGRIVRPATDSRPLPAVALVLRARICPRSAIVAAQVPRRRVRTAEDGVQEGRVRFPDAFRTDARGGAEDGQEEGARKTLHRCPAQHAPLLAATEHTAAAGAASRADVALRGGGRGRWRASAVDSRDGTAEKARAEDGGAAGEATKHQFLADDPVPDGQRGDGAKDGVPASAGRGGRERRERTGGGAGERFGTSARGGRAYWETTYAPTGAGRADSAAEWRVLGGWPGGARTGSGLGGWERNEGAGGSWHRGAGVGGSCDARGTGSVGYPRCVPFARGVAPLAHPVFDPQSRVGELTLRTFASRGSSIHPGFRSPSPLRPTCAFCVSLLGVKAAARPGKLALMDINDLDDFPEGDKQDDPQKSWMDTELVEKWA